MITTQQGQRHCKKQQQDCVNVLSLISEIKHVKGVINPEHCAALLFNIFQIF